METVYEVLIWRIFGLPRNHSSANNGVYIYRSQAFCSMAHQQIACICCWYQRGVKRTCRTYNGLCCVAVIVGVSEASNGGCLAFVLFNN